MFGTSKILRTVHVVLWLGNLQIRIIPKFLSTVFISSRFYCNLKIGQGTMTKMPNCQCELYACCSMHGLF